MFNGINKIKNCADHLQCFVISKISTLSRAGWLSIFCVGRVGSAFKSKVSTFCRDGSQLSSLYNF